MPWIGMTNLEQGLLMTIDMPYDSGALIGLTDFKGKQVYSAQVYWMSSMGKAAYPARCDIPSLIRAGTWRCASGTESGLWRGRIQLSATEGARPPRAFKVDRRFRPAYERERAGAERYTQVPRNAWCEEVLINTGASKKP